MGYIDLEYHEPNKFKGLFPDSSVLIISSGHKGYIGYK